MVLWNQQQPARQGLTLRANVNQPSGQQEANSSNSGFVYQPPVQKYLNDCRSFYSCIYCRTHLANHDELVSRSFQGNRSRAYLFNSVINVSCGPAVRRELNTGSHAVADVFCINCGTTIGWKYERAYVDSQRYKEGKYIIELAHVVRENRHLELDRRDKFLGLVSTSPQQQQQQHGAATIGTANGRGSLSPDSGQWSPGSSSSSSPSSASSNAETLEAPRRSPSCRYFDEQDASERQKKKNNNNNNNNNDDDDEPNDEDEEEILMFPFYDELYRNRSSCSNLSTSRSYQRRLRRSLYLEASPYDWKYARSRTVSSSSAAASGVASSPNDQLLQQPSIFSASSDSIEIPLSVAQNQGQVNGQTTEHQHEQQHETDNSKRQQLLVEYLASQLRALRSSSASGMDSEHEQLSSETSKRANRPSLSATSRRKADDGETQFEFEHDSQPSVDESVNDDEDDDEDEDEDDDEREKKSRPNDTKQQGLDCDRRPVASTSGEGANQQAKSSKAGPSSSASSSSLSLEEEEFYDCCTDHEVANYSAVGRK